jgi:TPR repeat protein
MSGEGVPFNPALAAALVRTAAERGDPEAQAEHGFRLALGIYPPNPGRREPASFALRMLSQGNLIQHMSTQSISTS